MTLRPYRSKANDRLSFDDWKILVNEWIAVTRGAEDTRHEGDHARWDAEVRSRMPILLRDASLALFALETGDARILEIVYSGVTPKDHVTHLQQNGLIPCQMTCDGLLAFRQRFKVSFNSCEITLFLRRALSEDDVSFYQGIPELTDRSVQMAMMSDPDLLERTGPLMAPHMARFLETWVQIDPRKLLSVFLVCAKEGLVKSVNAILAAGLNPFDALGSRDTVFAHPNIKALVDYRGALGAEIWPASFIKTLRILDAETPTSNHERMSRGEIFAPGATVRLLGQPASTASAGLSPQDWLPFRAAS